MNTLKQYLPYLSLVLATVLGVLATALGDGRLEVGEVLAIGISLATAVTTYIVPNVPQLTWVKPLAASLGAAFVALTSFLTDGVSSAEWVLVAIAVLGALGVVVTNKAAPLNVASNGRERAV